LCSRCQRSATWMASGARRAAPSNGTVGYQNCPNTCCPDARFERRWAVQDT
jgi:hypothetical protein